MCRLLRVCAHPMGSMSFLWVYVSKVFEIWCVIPLSSLRICIWCVRCLRWLGFLFLGFEVSEIWVGLCQGLRSQNFWRGMYLMQELSKFFAGMFRGMRSVLSGICIPGCEIPVLLVGLCLKCKVYDILEDLCPVCEVPKFGERAVHGGRFLRFSWICVRIWS